MLTVVASEAVAQDCKKITALPFSITVEGNYCVTKDLSTSISSATEVAAIEIRADNVVLDTESLDPNTSRGIWVLTGSDVLVVNNRIIKSLVGISFGLTATGLYRDNIATACTTPYSGGTNAGNNQ
jgi:hypothetical protein